jgi:hypothetical protein
MLSMAQKAVACNASGSTHKFNDHVFSAITNELKSGGVPLSPLPPPDAVRIMLVGDTHIRTQNIQQVDAFTTSLGKLLAHTRVDDCVLMGDIFHTIRYKCAQNAVMIMMVGLSGNGGGNGNHHTSSSLMAPRYEKG